MQIPRRDTSESGKFQGDAAPSTDTHDLCTYRDFGGQDLSLLFFVTSCNEEIMHLRFADFAWFHHRIHRGVLGHIGKSRPHEEA